MSLIEIDSVSFGYGPQKVLEKLTFSVEENDFLAILGPNGAGKTTLINLLAGLLKPQGGRIRIGGKSIRTYRRAELAGMIAMVRQGTMPTFGFTVRQTVMMARYCAGGRRLFETQEDRRISERSLEMTDTLRFADRPLTALSGGERQRVFIARALAQQTSMLLLDEPTSHLDLKHQIGIFELLKELCQSERKTVIVVSHDINLIQNYAKDYLLLDSGGRMLYQRDTSGLDSETVESFFGVSGVEGVVGGRRVFVPTGVAKTDVCGE
jgi:iron complex transport system ATP-binding protein